MKKCPTCEEVFADKFSYCPVDGTSLPSGVHASEVSPVAANAGPAGDATSARFDGGEPDAVAAEAADDTQTIIAAPPSQNGGGNGNVWGTGAAAPAAAGSASAAAAGSASASGREDFSFTFINDEGLASRLMREVREVAHESELTWPEFKRDPVGFTKRGATAYGRAGWRTVSQPYVAAGIMGAMIAMIALVGAVGVSESWDKIRCAFLAMTGRPCSELARNNIREDLEYLGQVQDVPQEQPTPEKGTAGAAKGTGGGSKPKQEKPGGGGGGGRMEQKPASFGKLPPASLTVPPVRGPDLKTPPIKNASLPVPASIDADPVLFPPDPRPLPYGDPKSKSTDPSQGPGKGGGIGTGSGLGVGSGENGGVGPGRGGNTGGGDRNEGGGGPGGGGGGGDYNRTFSAKEVTRKAQITSRPEPLYTEEARKNQITGSVSLRMVLNANGSVSNIAPLSRLPDGLTEKAIAAARQIKFSPAEKDGRKVSQYVTIQYNFNIY